MTGVGESTVICIVNEVSQAIVENLWTKFVSNLFPKNQGDFSNMMGEMDSEWQFPFAFSAIDGSHLPMKSPPGAPKAMKQYQNFKNFYSIILLALVDPKYRFIWASVGAPGKTHDSTLFQSTFSIKFMGKNNGWKYPTLIGFRNRRSSHSTVDSWGWSVPNENVDNKTLW